MYDHSTQDGPLAMLELYDLLIGSGAEPRFSQKYEISVVISLVNVRWGSKSNFCESLHVQYALLLFLLGYTDPI